MEILNELEITFLKKEEFNIYEKAHMIFYTKIKEEYNLLLLSESTKKEFSHLSIKVLPEDNSPIFSIARLLTNNITIFNEDNLHKIKNKENLSKEDLDKSKTNYHHELWEKKDYLFWLEKLSDENPVVQYDLIKSHIFYFWEIPELNIEKLNENLKEIDCIYYLSYFPYSEIHKENLKEKEINPFVLKFYKEINIEAYIDESLFKIANEELELFYVLSVKPSSGSKLDQAGFFHFPALFKGLYRKNTEKWIYLLCSQKLPNEKDLEKAKAIIIPGSHISINDNYDFLRDTEKWVKNFHANFPKVKLLGICFGMQIFMTSLGGKVEKLKSGLFELGPKKIEISENFWDLEFVKKSKIKKKKFYSMMQAHWDECTIIPKEGNLKNYGKSLNCFNEIMVSENERIFLVQGHPEYIPIFNIERMSPIILKWENKERTLENILKKKEEEIIEHEGDCHYNEYRQLCYSFLKN